MPAGNPLIQPSSSSDGLIDVMETDLELVERFREQNDEAAFNALVNRHQRDVYRLAFRISGNHEDAHDLAQEAFVRVYRKLGDFRGDAAFKTWLYRIVVNLSLNLVKKTNRQRKTHVDIDDVVVAVAPRGLRSALEAESHEQLRGAIQKLPEKQKKTLILKVFHELKYTEIAGVMKCSVGTSKANFFHAVQALKRHLGAVDTKPLKQEIAS